MTVLMVLDRAGHELALFAAVAFLVGGASDLLIDIIWLGRHLVRRATIYRRFQRADPHSLSPPIRPGRLVVFIPAWDEANVIAAMLTNAVAALGETDWRIYVGIYPNDVATMRAVRPLVSDRVRLAPVPHDGPTTKADCLNAIWFRMLADETAGIM